jgi:4-nitrophenyl phosphatase
MQTLLAYYSNMENEELQSYRVFLLDVDGVLVRGGEVIPGAIEGVLKLQETGKVLLLSNNSTRSRDQMAQNLRNAGFQIGAEEIVTSAFIASVYLREHYGSVRVWTVGEEGLDQELVAAGHKLVPPREADWVVAGMDRKLNYEQLAQGLRVLMAGARLLATNDDATFPTPEGPQPGAGAVIGAFKGMGFSPDVVIGKPSMIAFQIALEKAGCGPEEALMVGDRLETDILGASGAGIDSALVLTGVTRREMIEPDVPTPRFVAGSILDLAEGRFEVRP